MSKALITGGAGFIGGWLARALLDRGWSVDLLDNFHRGRADIFLRDLLREPRATLVEADLLQGGEKLDSIGTDYSHVFHLAAILGVQNVIDRPAETLSTNVVLLESALKIARRQQALSRFVFASTSEVYVGSLETIGLSIPTAEDHVLALPPLDRPRTAYMLSKIYGEAMVQLSGLPYTILRPHNVYGPRMGQSHVIPQLLRKVHDASEGDAIEVFSVNHTRTFCFIGDAVEMIVRAAEAPGCRDQVLNLGAQAPEHPIGTIAEIVIATVGKSLRISPAPETQGSPARRCPDMTKMTALCQYEASVSLEDGVARTYHWYCTHVFTENRLETAV